MPADELPGTPFQSLAQPFRLRLLEILSQGPACVSDLALQTGKRQPYVSQHLAALRSAHLVSTERAGRRILYHMEKDALRRALALIEMLCQQTRNIQKGQIMAENKAPNLWHGIPREEIQWYPTVITERCIGDGLCVTSCGKNVYAFDYETNKPVVVAPLACMVGCTTCDTNCT